MIIRIIHIYIYIILYISLIYPHFSPLYHCEFVILSFFEWTRLNMLFWVACQVLEVFKFAKTGSQGHHCRCTQEPQLPSAARYFFLKTGDTPNCILLLEKLRLSSREFGVPYFRTAHTHILHQWICCTSHHIPLISLQHLIILIHIRSKTPGWISTYIYVYIYRYR